MEQLIFLFAVRRDRMKKNEKHKENMPNDTHYVAIVLVYIK